MPFLLVFLASRLSSLPWENVWFWVIFSVSGFLITLGFIRYRNIIQRRRETYLESEVFARIQEIEAQKQEIEAQKRLLEEEKQKSDKLLYQILPDEIADELKHTGKSKIRLYREVSVMFTDFKGFTQIAENMTPEELVSRLENHFINFDRITSKHLITPIKTVGDSYMAAGGVPLRNKEHAVQIVLTSLEIQDYMEKRKEVARGEQRDFWELRVGIDTGPVIAGVIGTQRIAYDIWGDTVNVASRMEMTCDAGKINITGRTYEQIKPFFNCTFRGKILAKNKGYINMYYVDRIIPELSLDEQGKFPNSKFAAYVNLHLYTKLQHQKLYNDVLQYLNDNLDENLHYHGAFHTANVVKAVERLAIAEGIINEDTLLLKAAALFHDIGFVKQYEHNEAIGADMAREWLPKYGFSSEQIEKVYSLILITNVETDPNSLLEKIIRDADLDYLGREDFMVISENLKKELMIRGRISSDKQWDEIQVDFLAKHRYYTESARKLRRPLKEHHLGLVKERLAKNEY
jgi:class 3 adenylate cyclase/predicted metal-dependent HD superfamily phosphohydrolase